MHWLRAIVTIAACGSFLAACGRKSGRTAAELLPPIMLSVNVDKPSITVGDLIDYSITVNAASNVQFRMPQFAENLGGFAVSDWDPGKPGTDKDGRVRHTQHYKMETYLTGMYEIPPARVGYGPADAMKEVVSTPVCIEVRSVVQTNDLFSGIRDIKQPVSLADAMRARWKRLVAGGLVLAAVMAGAVVLATHFMRRARRPAPPVPAHEVAYAALRALFARNLVEAGLIKEYYFELSAILRHYIENRFGLRAPERTTEEFLAELGSSGTLVERHRQLLADFLAECDLVKFANYGASQADAQRAHDRAVSFIEETRERPEGQAAQEDRQV